MFDVGGGELLLIVFAILLLFGPKKIPEIAQMIGKGMQKVKQAQAQFQSQINDIQTEIPKAVDLNTNTSLEDILNPADAYLTVKTSPIRNIDNTETPKD